MLNRNPMLSLTRTTLLLTYIAGIGYLVMNPAGMFLWIQDVSTIRLYLCN